MGQIISVILMILIAIIGGLPTIAITVCIHMDRRGSGFKKILDSYEFQEHYTEEMKPEFRSSNSEFWLILRNFRTVDICSVITE